MSEVAKFDSLEIVHFVSLATPAVRMLVVSVGVDKDGEEWTDCLDINPVVAIQSTYFTDMKRRHNEERSKASTVQEALNEGWWISFKHTKFDPIIVDDEYGICTAEFAFDDVSNVAWKIVIADWDQSCDESNVKKIHKQLKEEAIRKVEIGH